jgi:hypothetical protein
MTTPPPDHAGTPPCASRRDRDHLRTYLPPGPGWSILWLLVVIPVFFVVAAPCWFTFILIPDLLGARSLLVRALIGMLAAVAQVLLLMPGIVR